MSTVNMESALDQVMNRILFDTPLGVNFIQDVYPSDHFTLNIVEMSGLFLWPA